MGNFSEIKKDACHPRKIPKKIKLNSNRTVILQSVINEIKAHGRSSMSMEVCGVLIGNLCWDKEPYLLIDARIEGKYADHQMASVTFTAETWDYIHSELSSKYPDRIIVGWYHTHPGFGIFLSQMDRFIHENFFGLKWQPAYVYDPQAETEGFFFWNETSLEQGRISIIPDKPADKVKTEVSKSPQKKKVVLSLDNRTEYNNQNILYGFISLIVFTLLLSLFFIVFLFWNVQGLKKENRDLEIENENLKKMFKEERFIHEPNKKQMQNASPREKNTTQIHFEGSSTIKNEKGIISNSDPKIPDYQPLLPETKRKETEIQETTSHDSLPTAFGASDRNKLTENPNMSYENEIQFPVAKPFSTGTENKETGNKTSNE